MIQLTSKSFLLVEIKGPDEREEDVDEEEEGKERVSSSLRISGNFRLIALFEFELHR